MHAPELVTHVSDGELSSDVARVDWYGNLQLAATEADLAGAGLSSDVAVEARAGSFAGVVGRTFTDAGPDGLVVYVDSGGHVAVACNGASARERLHDPERLTLKKKS